MLGGSTRSKMRISSFLKTKKESVRHWKYKKVYLLLLSSHNLFLNKEKSSVHSRHISLKCVLFSCHRIVTLIATWDPSNMEININMAMFVLRRNELNGKHLNWKSKIQNRNGWQEISPPPPPQDLRVGSGGIV